MDKHFFPINWIPITDTRQELIGISHCPGKVSDKRGSNKRLLADLRSLKRQNISGIVTLATEHEIKKLGIKEFNETVQVHSFKHYIEPIEDLSTPKVSRISHIEDLLRRVLEDVYDEKKILVHCNAGLGRSGIVVALLVRMIRGAVTDPIAYVRKYRPGAIETIEQKKFVYEF